MKQSLTLILSVLVLAASAGLCPPVQAVETRTSALYGEASEQQLPTDQTIHSWLLDPATVAADQSDRSALRQGTSLLEVNRVRICRTETVCTLHHKVGNSRRVQIKNRIQPLHYDKGEVSVPDDYMQQIRQVLMSLRGRENLTVRIIAYTDNSPLTERNESIYGDNPGLSKALARRVALAVQNELAFPGVTFESKGGGVTQPVAANTTPRGRSLNRRIEVEFWYDNPLQELPDEPQLCPEAASVETVTRVYTPLQDGLEPILFQNGEPVIAVSTIRRLKQIMSEVSDKASVRLRFIGYASDTRLDRRTAAIYGDDIGLSTARARRAMEAVTAAMGLSAEQAEFEGRGFMPSEQVTEAGVIASEASRVQMQVIYSESVTRNDYDDIDITRLIREVRPVDPFGLNLMRISVDGQPVDDPGKRNADVQRCTDVALDNAQIEFKYDNLKMKPRLNITAWPNSIAWRDREETDFVENRTVFQLYTNYHSFIDRAEVRIFDAQRSDRDTPLAVVPLDTDGKAHWQPDFSGISAQGYELKYLVRVYDRQGHFDETKTQPLWVIDQIDQPLAIADQEAELWVGYGETRLFNQNIPLTGGTVQAFGSAVPAGHTVWLAGYPVPVDAQGRFVAEELLPAGRHAVEVAVVDAAGNGELFLRDLELKKSDWFSVGIADLSLFANRTNGPATLLAPGKTQYSDDVDIQGRMAFYTNGKLGDGWGLTASADTRQGPVDEIFSNFLDKSPEALFRRIDSDDHMPTYGDDSTVEEGAPTLGKFYLKLKKAQNHALWGNFKIGYTDNDLAHVDRSLYGANLQLQSQDVTSFGEQRFYADGYAAKPGTVAGRDDFRGTGGSLYYLRHQDILTGSERVRIEVRDKDSGLVLGVKNLTPILDYDLDPLQGRLLLSEPLMSTAGDNLLVQRDAISGNPAYLVVRYEYTPGFDDPGTLTSGGRLHYWFGDQMKVGLTTNRDDEAGSETRLNAADVTLRATAATWLKLQAGRSEGAGLLERTSVDGGYNFTTEPLPSVDGEAWGYRVDGSLGLKDLFDNVRGEITFYTQDLEAGYAAPGLITTKDTSKYGGAADLPVTDRLHLHLKGDLSLQREGLNTADAEVNLDTTLSNHWKLGSGLRYEKRADNSAAPPPTQEEGDRTDAVLRLTYDSLQRWSTYGFAQNSLQTASNRDSNDRVGAGGSLHLTDRLKASGELSGGDLGTGARLGTEFLYSDRTTLYSNYTLENERSDNGLRARKGNLVSGFRTRYSDSVSLYLEEYYSYGDVPTGLTHSTGVDLAPTDRLNFGATLDSGNLVDRQTGAEIKRTAAGVRAGYGFNNLKLATAVEYRLDDSEQTDTTYSKRTTWLLKNSLSYQLSTDWRLIGKFNYSRSESSQGAFYDGRYTEAVVGYAYRPVESNRFNTLVKYTYFYNLPTADQVSGTSTTAGVIQRSHIADFDVMYDLTRRWTVGGKYAYRLGAVSQDRVHSDFFSSQAHLYLLRADWHVLYSWDALVEARRLDLPDARDTRSGVLVGLYRHLGEHIKLGVGYNFSDFSDDLTDMSYKHQGLFINLIGKM
ncbi:MAG: flagellar motor protein MotB [Desulfuromonadales bacterium]|nr:flagellar motor protein MotB [Desulfuromonadales bacterium]